METILYMKDNAGAMREWGISCDFDCITIRHGQMGGSMQYQTETVEEGKAGRTLEEQVVSRMNSRISKQKDRGYVDDEFEAAGRQNALNALGLLKPMLAQPIKNVKNVDYTDAVTQPKFDGNRCIIYCEDGINKAYSRNGKPMEAIGHILDDIALENGQFVDGELYAHGYPLQTIVSWIKREQANTLKLKYHMYDLIAPNLPFKRRSQILSTLPIGESISFVRGDPVASETEVYSRFRGYRDDGYEGAILRWGNAGYEDGKRSKSLVKIKEWEDAEFLVVGIESSRDGWARLECALPNFETFHVSAPGTITKKTEILQNKDLYIGKMVTVEYANLTADGVPFHPVALRFRDDL